MEEIELSLQEIKECEINILEKIDKICKKYNLKYSLMDGSAIGAVRHHGFIPWDDDIDIMMIRDDYNKLKDILKNNKEELLYLSCDTRDDYSYPYAKVVDMNTDAKEIGIDKPEGYGVFVDIFPIDKITNCKIEKILYLFYMKILYKIYFIKIYKKQISDSKLKLFLKNIMALLLKPINFKKLVKKMNQKSQIFNNCDIDNYAIIFHDTTLNKKITYKKDFFENIKYMNFENKEFLIINHYDEYLKNVFGEYMKLPPKENRKTNHNWEYLKKKTIKEVV